MNPRPLITTAALIVAFLGTVTIPSPVKAASQDECAIWLCLPGGFPAGCGAAKAAMVRRIKHHKPPLPPFSACAVEGGDDSRMSFKRGVAALIGEQRECIREGRTGADEWACVEWRTIPAHYKKGFWGRTGKDGCLGNYRYIEVFIDGEKAGETHYWK